MPVCFSIFLSTFLPFSASRMADVAQARNASTSLSFMNCLKPFIMWSIIFSRSLETFPRVKTSLPNRSGMRMNMSFLMRSSSRIASGSKRLMRSRAPLEPISMDAKFIIIYMLYKVLPDCGMARLLQIPCRPCHLPLGRSSYLSYHRRWCGAGLPAYPRHIPG